MASQNYYQKLPDLRSVRVIKLYSATNIDDVIRFDLITASLDASPIPAYEALSYTWAGQLSDQVVYSNNREFLVTENARNAMRRLRPYKPGKTRQIWIDAICINQHDDAEKSAQVQMMLEIYGKAKSVNIWLGEADEHSDLLFRWLRWTGAPFQPAFFILQKLELASVSSATPSQTTFFEFLISGVKAFLLVVFLFIMLVPLLPIRILPIFKDFKGKIRASVKAISAREYWERSWTIQEASINFNEFIICGSSRPLPYASFYAGHCIVCAFYASASIGREFSIERYALHLPAYRSTTDETIANPMLNSLCEKKATLPVDKIFAIRALLPGCLDTLPVDYSRPAADVFLDAARLIMKANNNAEFLRYACTENRTDGFPAWVPAWDTPSVVPDRLSKFTPAVISPYPIVDQDCEKGVLKLKALRADIVTANTSALFPTRPPLKLNIITRKADIENPDEAFGIFKAWAMSSPRYAASALSPELKQFASLMASMYRLETFRIRKWLQTLWDYSDHDILRPLEFVLARLRAFETADLVGGFLQLTVGRALFTTESGRVGLSTRVAYEGDEVMMLSGERMPYLVRKCADRPGKYVPICPCWISGAIKGETWPARSGNGIYEDFEYIEFV